MRYTLTAVRHTYSVSFVGERLLSHYAASVNESCTLCALRRVVNVRLCFTSSRGFSRIALNHSAARYCANELAPTCSFISYYC